MSVSSLLKLPAPFDVLPDDDQVTLRSYFEPVEFASGSRILCEGDPGDCCYLIEEGQVRIEVRPTHVDTENVLDVLNPGAFVGELSLIDRQPRSASAVAETDVRTHRFSTDALDELCREHPAVGMKLLQALGRDAAHKLRNTTARLATYTVPDERDPQVDLMVERAQEAQEAFHAWPEEKVDALLLSIAQVVATDAQALAEATVEETRLGNVRDKVTKIQVASMGVYRAIGGQTGYGELSEDAERRVTEIASAAGVIFGMVPVTNPVPTAVFKTLICLKARNALILSFHRKALGVGGRTGAIIRNALEQAGAPAHLVQWIEDRSSRKITAQFMSHDGVALILATGGSGMVSAAYSSGTPALGVGPGNAPAWICADADLGSAADDILLSKPFDHGLICGAENNLVVDTSVREAFAEALEQRGAAVLSEDEVERFAGEVVHAGRRVFWPRIIGQSAASLARAAGIERAYDIRLIVVPTDDASEENPFAGEKMAPILSLFSVNGEEEGMALCQRLLQQEGTGHTAVIHTNNEDLARRFAMEMPASRILVNSPGSQGVCGLTTGLDPSFTLGCGYFGGNATTDNITYRHLMNVKRLARRVEPEVDA